MVSDRDCRLHSLDDDVEDGAEDMSDGFVLCGPHLAMQVLSGLSKQYTSGIPRDIAEDELRSTKGVLSQGYSTGFVLSDLQGYDVIRIEGNRIFVK